jgi:hypothetical protein
MGYRYLGHRNEMDMMYTDLDQIHRPSNGARSPIEWGIGIEDNFAHFSRLPFLRAEKTALYPMQNIPVDAETPLRFDRITHYTAGMAAPEATNTVGVSEFVVPQSGVYNISAGARCLPASATTTSTSRYVLLVYVDGDVQVDTCRQRARTGNLRASVSSLATLQAGQTYSVSLYQTLTGVVTCDAAFMNTHLVRGL